MQCRMQHNNGSKNSVGGAKIHWMTASRATLTLAHFYKVGDVPASFGCKSSCKHMVQQECIPVGYVPSAAVAVCWGGSASVHAGIQGYTSPPRPEPGPLWACRPPPPSQTPNLPPPYGSGDPPPGQTPQPPLWVWVWRTPLPVNRMTDTCKNITFANFVYGR